MTLRHLTTASGWRVCSIIGARSARRAYATRSGNASPSRRFYTAAGLVRTACLGLGAAVALQGDTGLRLLRQAYAEGSDDLSGDHVPFPEPGPEPKPAHHLMGLVAADKDTDIIAASSRINFTAFSETHACQIASNAPCEDVFHTGTIMSASAHKPLFGCAGIYDGHAGPETARVLHGVLPPYMGLKLQQPTMAKDPEDMTQRLKEAFLKADEAILTTAKQALQRGSDNADTMNALWPALSGSCALVSIFDLRDSKLYVANTGDSRAVLGRHTEGTYKAHALSFDHTGFNQAEVARIQSEHPGETGIIDPATGRIFGLAIVRAFGDVRWKWDDATNMDAHKRFWGPKPRPGGVVKTPPYVTAEPEVTVTELVVRGKTADFVIMASDGLWDHLSNEDAVLCVEEWLRRKRAGDIRKLTTSETMANEDMYYDERPGYGLGWRIKPEYFSYEDDNAAACLVRNAFGGRRKNLVERVSKAQPPHARDVHDDTTVLVTFYGDV
ncbi:hypothetical protein CAC42_7465 [Sphaceloma murrayae]|uniref:PPM-type phosphatase domain-containing protein n=1 Tax=Sphaceloma murrayae TaxID=2082308 RepID=A0A2K1QX39_9PEZI|nr:hypothetical protein CAC42_7465 [Sphaceloma murrayae]